MSAPFRWPKVMSMGSRKDSVMTSLWLDAADHAEIERRAKALGKSKAEVMRRMIRYAIAAAQGPKRSR